MSSSLSILALAEALSVEGSTWWADRMMQGASIDTRTLQKDQVFFALSGVNTDGHDYLAQAVEQGASALVVSQRPGQDLGVPVLQVEKVEDALWQAASWKRKALQARVFALTGSVGKSSTKQIAQALSAPHYRTHVTQGSYNNHLGVPLTLLNAPLDSELLIVELGANHLGELRALGDLVLPERVLITGIGTAHVGDFGGVDKIIEAKGEIMEASSVRSVVLNAASLGYRTHLAKAQSLGLSVCPFGSPGTKVHVHAARSLWQRNPVLETCLHYGDEIVELQMPMLGSHGAYNLSAALALLWPLKLPVESFNASLRSLQLDRGRLEPLNLSVATQRGSAPLRVINDSFNASFDSYQAALQTLKQLSPSPLAVLGDMAGLGDQSEHYHTLLAKQIAQLAEQGNLRFWSLGKQLDQALKSLEDTSALKKAHLGSFLEPEFSLMAQNVLSYLQSAHSLEASVMLLKGARIYRLERLIPMLSSST